MGQLEMALGHEVRWRPPPSPVAALPLSTWDVTSLVTPIDSRFPSRLRALPFDGVAIAAPHQVRDGRSGSHARVTAGFTLPTMGRMSVGHRGFRASPRRDQDPISHPAVTSTSTCENRVCEQRNVIHVVCDTSLAWAVARLAET
jgi:hypothetical protein